MYQNEYRGKQTTDSTETMFSIVPLGACTYRHMSDDDVFHLNVNRLEKGLVSREYPVFYASDDNNLDFIVQQINSSAEFRSFCAEQKKGGTRTRLYYKNLCEFQMLIPNTEEQEKIATFLLTLDTLITLHQRECFSFDFSGESAKTAQKTISWEQRKLSDMVERVTRKNENLESELPLTISAQYGLIDQNEFFDKRIASRDVSGYYLLKKGEFAYNKSTSSDAPWGAVKRLDRYEMGVLSTLYIVFALKEDGNIDSDFLVSYYDTDCWHKGVQAIAAEGARNHGLLNITPADYFETVLTVPSNVKEQHQIGTFFAKLDSLITLHQHKPNKKGHDVLSVMPFKGNQRKPHYLCT